MHSNPTEKGSPMTKQHFTDIAAILAGQFAEATPEEKLALWKTTLSLADYFKRINPRFDRVRFYLAVFGTVDHFSVRDKAVRDHNAKMNLLATGTRNDNARRTEVI